MDLTAKSRMSTARFMRPLRAMMALIVMVAVVFAAALPVAVSALEVPPVPTDIPILDQTNTLTPEQKAELAGLIDAERKSTGNQIGILMIPTLGDEALEDYSIEVARKWGIGSEKSNNGVFLLVAKNDRRVRIEVGYGLEGALTDIRSGQIIRDRMAPQFREGKYFEGIKAGVAGITVAIHNEVDPALRNEPVPKPRKFPLEFLFFALFFIPSWLASMLARTKSWWAGGVLGIIIGGIIAIFAGFLFFGLISMIVLALIGLLFDRAVSNNFHKRANEGLAPSWWAGGTHIGGGGNSDSGGFGGFGGGSFGGGGASGDW